MKTLSFLLTLANTRFISPTLAGLAAAVLSSCDVAPAPYSLDVITSTTGVCGHVLLKASKPIYDFREFKLSEPDVLLRPDVDGVFTFLPEQRGSSLQINQKETVQLNLQCEQSGTVFPVVTTEYTYAGYKDAGGAGPLVRVVGDITVPERLTITVIMR